MTQNNIHFNQFLNYFIIYIYYISYSQLEKFNIITVKIIDNRTQPYDVSNI